MVLLIMPMMVLSAAAFRDRSPEEARLIADLAWLPLVGVNSTVLVQWLIIGTVILQDRRANPVFPRIAAVVRREPAGHAVGGSGPKEAFGSRRQASRSR